jgi:hypothetical protein
VAWDVPILPVPTSPTRTGSDDAAVAPNIMGSFHKH